MSQSEDPERLLDLIVRWEVAASEGHPLTPEELCAGCPDLIEAVRERIERLRRTAWMNRPVEVVTEPTEPFPRRNDLPTHSLLSGRYRIDGLIGEGGFGRVHRGFDTLLQRPVAIKVPNPERISRPEDVEAYLNEARILASLDHAHIVPVHDVGRSDDGLCYVVSRYVEGGDLATTIKKSRLSHQVVAKMVATVAEALHYAHSRGLVHRDIKPANILIDTAGTPCVADFGHALRDEDFGKGERHTGTPSYMSPEQARGEGHRVDGRSDIFSLGVVLYELLTRRRPFRGDSHPEVMEQIANVEPEPPRHVDETIPKELERICLKSLAKRLAERYTTAGELAEDLRIFLQTSGDRGPSPIPAFPALESTLESTRPQLTARQSDSNLRPVRVVPKGLRSFDEQDADFFLELLPGPRDRDGLPESIRFWKRKIEQVDPDLTFRVGLIYGPSGCGKSSLVKAGLLPRLGRHVLPVYIEATPEATEARLLKGLRKACPELPTGMGLVESLANLRRGRILPPGRKVLLVLDQFEQWLHARRGQGNAELVATLRQCDGEHVLAVVMVRDDFWLAVSRFMADLEVELIQGENTSLVDLFDLRHARKVLTAFGTAYGNVPDRTAEISRDQHAFLDQAISELTQDGKIVSVRLALFAEMMKGKTWTPATLRAVGGTGGVGVAFLEETFSSPQANPKHRLHQKAAQAVLNALLTGTDTDIRGQMRSEAELREAAAHGDRPREFADLTHILDNELRLITPTDPERSGEQQATQEPAGRYFQLTHDYLVHSLRDWLTRKQRETRRGRAELRLAERSSDWNARPENRHLPSLLEWANIKLLTRKKGWNESQRQMMKRASRVHGSRAFGAAALIALLIWGGVEGYGRLRASSLVDSLKTASTSDVPAIIRQLQGYRRWANPRLELLALSADDASRVKLHASLALLPVDPSQLPYLEKHLLDAMPGDLPVLRDALQTRRATLLPRLWSVLEAARPGDPRLLRASSALASYAPDDGKWEAMGAKVSQSLVSLNPVFLGSWLNALRPVRRRLTAPLASIFRDRNHSESEHTLATNILADYASDDPDLIADLLMDADPRAYGAFFPIAQRQASKTLPLLRAVIAEKATTPDGDKDAERVKDRLAERQARSAISLLRMGQGEEVLPLLRHSADPRLRSFIVNWLSPLEADPKVIADALEHIDPGIKPVPAKPPMAMDAILFHPETSMRRALILALGTYGMEGLSAAEREPLCVKLIDLYRNDPDSGIHGAAAWTLRQWKQQEKLAELDAGLSKIKGRGDHRWFVNGQGQTFAVIEGPVEFPMGSPPDEPDRDSDETLRRRRIPRRFAIATQEVTVVQYQRFVRSYPQFDLDRQSLERFSPMGTGPRIAVSWYGAVAFCNWLSEQEGLPKDQWCYLPNPSGAYKEGMRIPGDVLNRLGYRLPTDAEWEYACRSGTITSRHYGQSTELLGKHAWYQANSQGHAWSGGSLLPNDLGLFDMLGNVFEWVQEMGGLNPGFNDEITSEESVYDKNPRLLRGGTYDSQPGVARSAYRLRFQPSLRYSVSGFRPSRTCP